MNFIHVGDIFIYRSKQYESKVNKYTIIKIERDKQNKIFITFKNERNDVEYFQEFSRIAHRIIIIRRGKENKATKYYVKVPVLMESEWERKRYINKLNGTESQLKTGEVITLGEYEKKTNTLIKYKIQSVELFTSIGNVSLLLIDLDTGVENEYILSDIQERIIKIKLINSTPVGIFPLILKNYNIPVIYEAQLNYKFILEVFSENGKRIQNIKLDDKKQERTTLKELIEGTELNKLLTRKDLTLRWETLEYGMSYFTNKQIDIFNKHKEKLIEIAKEGIVMKERKGNIKLRGLKVLRNDNVTILLERDDNGKEIKRHISKRYEEKYDLEKGVMMTLLMKEGYKYKDIKQLVDRSKQIKG